MTFTPEALEKIREGARRGGSVKNPNKGFGSNRELARKVGRKSKPGKKIIIRSKNA